MPWPTYLTEKPSGVILPRHRPSKVPSSRFNENFPWLTPLPVLRLTVSKLHIQEVPERSPVTVPSDSAPLTCWMLPFVTHAWPREMLPGTKLASAVKGVFVAGAAKAVAIRLDRMAVSTIAVICFVLTPPLSLMLLVCLGSPTSATEHSSGDGTRTERALFSLLAVTYYFILVAINDLWKSVLLLHARDFTLAPARSSVCP